MAPEVNFGDTVLAFRRTDAARGDVVSYEVDRDDELFVLNDVRQNIMDSRVFGPIAESQITGRHVVVVNKGGDDRVEPLYFDVWVVTEHVPVGMSFTDAHESGAIQARSAWLADRTKLVRDLSIVGGTANADIAPNTPLTIDLFG